MFEIVIDTNIYRKDPSQTSLPFKALSRLCKAKTARLHIPYIVKREFQTQQVNSYQKEMQISLSSINGLLKKNLSMKVRDAVSDIKSSIEASFPLVTEDAETGIVKWAEEIGAVVYPLVHEEAEKAMEAYFNGHPPLKEPKIRKDIPDAFLFQSVLSISKNSETLYVISEDGPFHDAATTIPNAQVFKSLNDFIEVPEVQTALQKQDEAEKIAKIIAILKERSNEEIAHVINRSIGEKITWEKIHDNSIPDDNHEATISSYGEAEDIAIDFNDAAYYGEGQLGIPFTCTMLVSAFYYIFKSDYYSIDEARMPSVSDHNDHYFEAEAEFEIIISGSISIDIDIDQFDENKEVDDYVDFDSIDIEGVTSIDLKN